MPEPLTVPIINLAQQTLGEVTFNPEDVLDVALTPVVLVEPGKEPRIVEWRAHPRTQTNARPRDPAYPHSHQ